MRHNLIVRRARAFALAVLTLAALVPPVSAQANIYGQWSTLPYLMPFNPVHVTLLPAGKVLIVSGSGNVVGNLDYESAIWDPQAGTFTTQALTWDMFCNGMVGL